MDVNNTHFHLILREDEWLGHSDGASSVGLSWDSTCGGVSLIPQLFRFPDTDSDPVLKPEDRRGAAVDQYGNWYWISDDRAEIRILPLDRQGSIHFWDAADLVQECPAGQKSGGFRPVQPAKPPTSMIFGGLAVTSYHYLVVGVLKPAKLAGLLIFDLHAGGTPTQLLWPEAVPFEPFDMAAAPDGGVWILDARNKTLWKSDRYFRWGNKGNPFDIVMENAVSIEAAPDGSVLILDTPPGELYSTVYHCRIDTDNGTVTCNSLGLDTPFVAHEQIEFPSSPPTLKGHDMAFIPDEPEETAASCTRVAGSGVETGLKGTLVIAEAAGNQAYGFRLGAGELEFTLELLPLYYPMRNYRGRALAADGNTVYYDMGERWLPLTYMPRPRYLKEGDLVLPVFDGKEPDCVWHRLFIDAYIPSGTSVFVQSVASNSKEGPSDEDWGRRPQPVLYRRGDGGELPYYNPFAAETNPPDGLGTWELLFQEMKGRYLYLRLTVTGPGNLTPSLYALRVYYPRFSYLKEYLPAVYREDEISASFLDRFLANIEGFYTVLEGRIASVQAIFDVDITAKEYLDWLAQWFGVVLDPAWDESRRRLFLRHAAQLFTQRGTAAGLIRMIRLAIEPCPGDELFDDSVDGGDCCSAGAVGFSVRIVESFLTRGFPGVVYGDATDTAAPGYGQTGGTWTPVMGAAPLHEKYRNFLKQQYNNTIETLNNTWGRKAPDKYESFGEILLPPVKPGVETGVSEAEAADWLLFLDTAVGFTYAPVDPGDASHQSAYRDFLERRYRRVDRLNSAYTLTGSPLALGSFYNLQLPVTMPSDGIPLIDWIQFVSQVMPIKENAHRFTVLVPMGPQMDVESREQRLEQVKRIMEIEKPAHTYCEVKPYWALFRVGEARLGLDTLPGEGSRFTALVLGRHALAESYLSAPHPWEVEDRRLVGRDPVGPGSTTWAKKVQNEIKISHMGTTAQSPPAGGYFTSCVFVSSWRDQEKLS